MLSYYREPGVMTSLEAHAARLAGLPDSLEGLVGMVQGLAVHIFWAERYGLALTEARQAEVQIRPAEAKLDRVLEINNDPFTQARPLEQRLVSNCRDFTVLLISLLKRQGVLARARCGFGVYFLPNHFEDHWIAEVWNDAEARWMQVDSQLDALQREVLGISFDPLDMPPGQFITGGAAWQMCRRGEANPDSFGIFDMRGIDFIKNDLLLDVRALNNIELLPWDICGLACIPYAELTPEQMALLDHAAQLSTGGDECFEELRALYNSRPELHPDPAMLF